MKDVIIIGNGPAGISAALYTCRAGLSTTIIGLDNGALEKAEKIENYFGLANPVSGRELVETGVKQAKKLGAELVNDEVLDVMWMDDFTVTAKSTVLQAKAVILTTGASRKKLKIKGISEYEGKGVSYCAVCDAFFYKQKPVSVIGNGEYALHEVNELIHTASSITLFTNGTELQADFPQSVNIIKTPISNLYGSQKLEGVELADNSRVSVAGLFIAIGTAAAADLARKLGVETNVNSIVVDDKMSTNVPGLFAAGDCIGGIMQVSVAVGEGAKAALSAIEFVRNSKKAVG
ncbi:MAG: thioredoxin reductase [Clostridiales bacterium GWF2_36_10]|nr:MAG: thioredoxin reductase [Clostridiales bacterium GWF2_36_10]HAN21200.1 thioredoxin reductase [Clostridiales bacterium]